MQCLIQICFSVIVLVFKETTQRSIDKKQSYISPGHGPDIFFWLCLPENHQTKKGKPTTQNGKKKKRTTRLICRILPRFSVFVMNRFRVSR